MNGGVESLYGLIKGGETLSWSKVVVYGGGTGSSTSAGALCTTPSSIDRTSTTAVDCHRVWWRGDSNERYRWIQILLAPMELSSQQTSYSSTPRIARPPSNLYVQSADIVGSSRPPFARVARATWQAEVVGGDRRGGPWAGHQGCSLA